MIAISGVSLASRLPPGNAQVSVVKVQSAWLRYSQARVCLFDSMDTCRALIFGVSVLQTLMKDQHVPVTL